MTLKKVIDHLFSLEGTAYRVSSRGINLYIPRTYKPVIILILENDDTFGIGDVPVYIYQSLLCLKSDSTLPKNEFYLVKQLANKGLNPFGVVKSVNMSIEYDNTNCFVNKNFKEKGFSKYDKPVEIISCRGEELHESCKSIVTLEDQSVIELDDARAGFLTGLMYKVPIRINGKELSDFSIQEISCSSDPTVALDLKDSKDLTPAIAGFHDVQLAFLRGYDYKSKQFTPVYAQDPRETIESFIFKMNELAKRGIKPHVQKIEIDSFIPETDYCAATVTVAQNGSTGKYVISPSDVYLLAQLLGVNDVSVDDQLKSKIESQFRSDVAG